MNIKQLITANTRKDSRLDLIITNVESLCSNVKVFDPLLSDHAATSVEIKLAKPKPPRQLIEFRNYNNAKTESFVNMLCSMAESFKYTNNVSSTFECFISEVLNVFNKQCPKQKKSIPQRDKKHCITESTKKLMKQRDKLYSQRQKGANSEELDKLNKQVKKQIILDNKEAINDEINHKGIWPVMNKLLKQKVTPNIPFNANELNDYFTSISGSQDKIPTNNLHSTKQNETSYETKFSLKPITPFALAKAWKKMRKRDSVTEDALGISNKMVDLIITCPPVFDIILKNLNMTIEQNNIN
ncbi:unnamed protein product [Orchesella dallaii]|uniref:Uncharacterized protein n=1 Tax=Orchesella dallaii TaxID=48710 RepID=A0ABP1RZD0_9HEXA